MEKVGYLGPEGSYSYLAAKYMRPDAELHACAGFPQVFGSLVNGAVDGIVVPIENTVNGGVLQNIDLLQETVGAYAVEEKVIKIDHRLATLGGAKIENIKRVYSHIQALEQCSKYLSENLPSARLVPAPSTAASLERLVTEEDACIVGSHVVRQGVALSESNIADEQNNYTHFLRIVKGEIPGNAHSCKIYFSVACKNRSGALLSFLERISKFGINMTKIESRPIKNAPDEYRFFIEIEGDYADGGVKAALKEIESAANSFKLLGCY